MPCTIHFGTTELVSYAKAHQLETQLLLLRLRTSHQCGHTLAIPIRGQRRHFLDGASSGGRYRPSQNELRINQRISACHHTDTFARRPSLTSTHGSAPSMAAQRIKQLPGNRGDTGHHSQPVCNAFGLHVHRSRTPSRRLELELDSGVPQAHSGRDENGHANLGNKPNNSLERQPGDC